MTNTIDIKKSLKIEWAILKNSEAPKVDRRNACNNIVKFSNELKEIDDSFEVIDISATQYAEFLPTDGTKVLLSVNWGEVDDEFGKEEQGILEKWTAVAVRTAHKRLPRESLESQKFGMVVNAITTHLLQIHSN